MAHYLLAVCFDDEYESDLDLDDPDAVRTMDQIDAVHREMQAHGVWVFAGGLRPASSATVVRADAGGVSMTDGPYAESKEQMGGFWLIDAADLDEALMWAGRAAAACECPIEVRPLAGLSQPG